MPPTLSASDPAASSASCIYPSCRQNGTVRSAHFAACYSGGIKAGETAVAPLRALGTPIADVIGPHPFTTWQTMFDPLLNAGARNYWNSDYDLDDLSDAAIEVIVDGVRTLPTSECEIFIAHVGGAITSPASRPMPPRGRTAGRISS